VDIYRGQTVHRPLDLHPERAVRRDGDLYAIVDIGSNSVRLVVYDKLARAPLPRFNEKSLCRLGAGLEETGELAAESFQRTVEAARRFRAIADAMGVARIDVLATEAVRRASNGSALVTAIAAEVGLDVRILTGAEEAYFASMGVISGFYRPMGMVSDMGGGSLEVAEVLDDQVGERSVSLPLGALPVQEMLAVHGAADAKERIDALLKEKLVASMPEPVLYAIGGGWRALARVHMAATVAPVRVAHGYTVEARDLRTFAKKLWRLPKAKLATLPGVPTRRVSTIAAAALVLDRLIKRLASERIVFSALGVREGWLYQQLTEQERYLDPLLEGAQAFGLPQARVPEFAPALARWTDGLFPGETHADRRLRVAACALSDIGWRIHPDFRSIDCFERLVQFPFVGLDHMERVFLAATIHARHAGSHLDDPRLKPAIDLLPASSRRRAQILGRAMLVGYRLSGCVPEILERARLRIEPDQVRLGVSKRARGPDSEVVGDRLKLLAQAVGVRRFEIVECP
jgi:exopolyphosphatase/guanosine-5'-triphosphate,3'-diphosphate pyrophosphatase